MKYVKEIFFRIWECRGPPAASKKGAVPTDRPSPRLLAWINVS